jgi:poly(3-hydroxybutyrate) depolymerase
LLVPEGLSTSKQAPVVVDVPGFSESPYYQVALTGIREYLDTHKWVGVVPFGTASSPTDTCCPSGSSTADCLAGKTLDKRNPCSFNAGSCCGAAPSQQVDDVAFAREMVNYVVKNMCGDSTNVFATGFSNGGMMSNRLGCQAADLFKGVAPVAGNIKAGVFQSNFRSCTPSEPTAWISLCGDRDSVCNSDFQKTAEEWAVHNQCNVRSGATPTYNTATTHCFAYSGCAAPTEYCTIDGLGHEWPGIVRVYMSVHIGVRDRETETRETERQSMSFAVLIHNSYPGRMRPDGTSPAQPSTNVDATAFVFEKFAAMVQ